MSEPSDSAAFRATATNVYRVVRVCLPLIVVASGWGGWHFWGWIGLAIGVVAGSLLAIAFFVVATLLWVLSQDGA